MPNIFDYYTKRPGQEGWEFGRLGGLAENIRSRLLASRAARASRPGLFDFLKVRRGMTPEAQAATRVRMPIRGPQEAPLASRLAIPRTTFPVTAPARAPGVQDAIERLRRRVSERKRISTEIIGRDPFAASYVPQEETLRPDYIEPSPEPISLPQPKAGIEYPSTAGYQLPAVGLNLPRQKQGLFARLSKGWENMDEDTRKNLALSALAGSLGLMAQQKYTTVPHSPVAEIGEAGLGGLQTYVTLAAADRKEKLLEAERFRKELRDEQTRRHQERMEGFREREVRRHEPGGIDYKEILARIQRGNLREFTYTGPDGRPVKEVADITTERGKTLLNSPLVQSVTPVSVQTEAGTKYMDPFEAMRGPTIPGPTKYTPFGGVTGPKGEQTKGYLEKRPGKEPVYKELLRGMPQSEEKTKQAIRKEEVRLLDSEMAQRRSNAAAQIKAITNIDGQSIMSAFASAKPGESANSILANMGIKLNSAGIAKVEKIYADLIAAEKAWSKRRAAYTPGGSLLPDTIPSADDPFEVLTR